MADQSITPHWSSWGAWQIHGSPGATTTYASYRSYWVPNNPSDPRAGSRVERTEARYKTEQTPGYRDSPGGIPSQPQPTTPTKTEPTTEYLAPTPESEKAASDVVVQQLQGKYVDVMYRTPAGVVKTYRTKNYDPSTTPGEFMSIGISDPRRGRRAIPFFDVSKQVLKTEAPMIKLRREYAETGIIPSWASSQIDVPSEIGLAGGTEILRRISYEKFLNLDISGLESKLETSLRSSKWYMETQPIYGKNGKTFSEIKKEEPALYLKQTISGEWEPQTDISRWSREHWKELGKIESILDLGTKLVTGVTPKQATSAFSSSIANVFTPSYWVASDKAKYLHEKGYSAFKKMRSGDVVGAWWGVAGEPMSTVVIPATLGAGFVAGIGYIGAAGIAATAGGAAATGAALTGYASMAPYVIGGVAAGVAVADIGLTAKTYGIESEIVRTKIAQIGTAVVSAGLGAKAVMGYKPKVQVTKHSTPGAPEVFTAKKYLFNIGDKPMFPYGKTQVGMSPEQAWYWRQAYAQPGKTWWGESEIGRLSQYTQTRMNYLNYAPANKLIVNQWGNKLFVETGSGWQPQTGLRYLPSTKVLPKPIPYRAYQTHFFVLSYTPPNIIFSGKPIPGFGSKIKPFKPFHKTIKDVIDSDKTISEILGKNYSVDKQGTVTIQKQKTILKQVTEQKLLLETTKLVVPKELLKRVLINKQLQLQKQMQKSVPDMQMFKGLTPLYATKTLSKQKQKTSFAFMFGQTQQQASLLKQKQAQLSKTDLLPKYATMQTSATLQAQMFDTSLLPKYATMQTSATLQAQMFDQVQKLKFDSVHIQDLIQETMTLPGSTMLPGDIRKKHIASDVGQGYNVMVKDRHFFHGKSTGKQRFIKVNKNPLSQVDAMALGSHAVDNSAAATFFIKPTRKPAQDLDMIIPSWESISYKFRTKTGKPFKPGGKLIERTTHRIDSPGEKAGITALAWIDRQLKKPKRVGVSRPKASKVSRDPMSFLLPIPKATKSRSHVKQRTSFLPRLQFEEEPVDRDMSRPRDIFEEIDKKMREVMKIGGI